MDRLFALGARLLGAVFMAAVAQGVILFLREAGLDFPALIASALGAAMTPGTITAIGWLLSGLAGLSYLFFAPPLPVIRERLSALIHRSPRAVDAPTAPQTPLRANWTIRELFFHIDPNAHVEDGTKRPWRQVGHKIKTAHANGDLVIWATPMPEDFLEEMDFPEARKPPVRLRTDYWQDGDFTYSFFPDTDAARFSEHCKTHGYNRREESYCDLQVNKEQALSLWPPSIAKDEAAGGIAVWKLAEQLSAEHGWTIQQAANAIESAASLGRIEVIGREMGGPGMLPLRRLKVSLWEDHYMSLHLPGHGELAGQTFAKSRRTHLSSHYDLRVYEDKARKVITKDSGLERDRG